MTQTLDPKALKQPDTFTRETRKAFMGMASHTQLTLGAFIAVGVIGLAIGFYTQHKTTSQAAEMAALYEAEQAYETELKALPTDPNLGAPEFRTLDVAATFPKTVAAYENVAKKQAKSRGAQIALRTLGNLFMDHGNPTEAIKWYDQAIAISANKTELAAAQYAKAVALENTGKVDEAIQILVTMTQKGDGSKDVLQGESLLLLGRLYMDQNKNDLAKKTFEKISKDLPNSPEARLADTLKGQVE